MATTLDWVKSVRADICGDYDQVVQEEKIRLVIDDLNDRQYMVYEIIKERSAKDLPTTYKEVAPLLEDIKDPERQTPKEEDIIAKLCPKPNTIFS